MVMSPQKWAFQWVDRTAHNSSIKSIIVAARGPHWSAFNLDCMRILVRSLCYTESIMGIDTVFLLLETYWREAGSCPIHFEAGAGRQLNS